MAKEINKFMKDFNKSVSDIFSQYATKKGVPSVVTTSDLDKLKINTFKGVQINQHHKELIVSAFRRDGLKEGLLAIRDRNADFRHSHEKATADALKEAGVDPTIFGEKYYSMQTMQVGIKKFSKQLDKGEVTPEQFFKVATSLAYVIDTYDKSKTGIEYLAKIHESVIPQLRGVSQLKKDGTAEVKQEYADVFSQLGVSTERLSSLISGKDLPKDLAQETESVNKIDFNLKNEPVQNLTTNGMKIASYAANQSYSLIAAELLKGKMLHGKAMEDVVGGLSDKQQELIMPLLSLNGEENIAQVDKSSFFKEALIGQTVYEIMHGKNISEMFSKEFTDSIPDGLTAEQQETYVYNELVGKILDASVATGALAADNKEDFLFEISKACAKSPEIGAMFPGYQVFMKNEDKQVNISDKSYLFHEGNIYLYDNVDETHITDGKFEEIKDEIKAREEAPRVDARGNELESSFVDLQEANVENFAPNCGNALVNAFVAKHYGEKVEKAIKEEEKLRITKQEISTKQSKTGLYRTLPQYAEYMKMYQNYFSRYGVEISSASATIAAYKERQQAAEKPKEAEVGPAAKPAYVKPEFEVVEGEPGVPPTVLINPTPGFVPKSDPAANPNPTAGPEPTANPNPVAGQNPPDDTPAQ